MKKEELKKIFWNSWETDKFYSKFSTSNDLNIGRSEKFHTFFVKMDPKKVVVPEEKTKHN